MNLSETFEVMAGSTAGSRHRTNGNLANNQDAFLSCVTPTLIVGTVSDGCGSQPHSEFGAMATVNILHKLITKFCSSDDAHSAEMFEQIYEMLVQRLKATAKNVLNGPLNTALNDYMMATAGGFIMTPDTTTFFGAGDFVGIVNGEQFIWEPEEGNKPLYPALSLAFPNDARFKFNTRTIATKDLNTCMFATDGGGQLIEICGNDNEYVPGTEDELAGPIDKIWTTDEFYEDPEACGQWLNRLAQNWRMPGPPHHGGLLDDDTTLIGVRRREDEETPDT